MKKRVPGWAVLLVVSFLVIPGFAAIAMNAPGLKGEMPGKTNGGAPFPGGRASSRAAEPSRPDIVLANISWSLDGSYDGATCTLLATVFNEGLSTASAFPVELYSDGVAVGSPVVNGLTGGALTTVKASLTINSGDHEFRALADPGNLVAESNETNNFRLAYTDIPFPDMVISNVSWYPQDYLAGEKVTVAATISNIGKGGTARQFAVESFIDQTRLTNRIIGGLGTAGTALATFQWTASSGNHTLFMNIDPGNAVLESNELNNRYISHIGQDFPDIVPTNLTISPAEFVDGGPATITATLTNAGKGGAARQFKVGFVIDGEAVGTAGAWGIAPGASAPVSINWKASPGHHDIAVIADISSELDESVESNNGIVRSFDVPWPDMVVRDLRWNPAVPTDGRDVGFNLTVLNRGNGSTARQFDVAFMVDGVQISTTTVYGLDKGQQKNLSAVWTAVPGSHEIRAMADPSRVIAETDDTNNAAVASVDVPYPNIQLSSFNFTPRRPDPGTPVKLSASVINSGPGNSTRRFEVRFFAAGKEAGSVLLDGLNTGFTRNVSVDWKGVPGTSELAVFADAGGAVMELSELDNTAATSIDVPFPDIAMTGMRWTPAGYTPGQPLNVSVDIVNTGSANQTGTLLVYLYADSSLVASTQVPGILSGENRTVGMSFLPVTAPTTIWAQADPQGTVVELSETNNALALMFPNRTVVAPGPPIDLQIIGLRSFPEVPMDGDRVSVVATVKAFNLSSGPSLDVDLLLVVDAVQAASQKTAIMAEEGLVTFEWTAVPGNHHLRVVADPENHIPEILEDNNILSFDLAVPAADIAITGLGPSWPNATDGEVASVTCAMANIGSGGTRRDLAITLYVDGELVRTAVQSGLPAGHNNSVVLSFPAYPGTHRLKAQVNSGVSVLETSVLNNAAFSRLDVQKPNMIVTAIDAATEADEGAPVTVTATIANNGGGTTRDIQVAFLIDAIQLARVSVSSLLEGRSITVSAVWTARPGIHLLTVMADTGGLAGESDETDNWFSVRGIDVASADIAVLELGIEGPPVSGADRLVWARIQNAGSATSEEMDICFSLDEVQRRTVKLGGMPANSSYIVSQLIPLGTGIHTLKVTADALDSVQELDETNNDAVIDIGSLEAPELALAALRVPDTAIDGEEVQVFAEVENAGLASFSDRFDVAIFVDGLLVADVPVDGMVAGGSTTVSARWTASPGTHIFRAIVDRQNSVAEGKETDNELHRQGAAVEQPDLIARDVFAYKSLGQEATDTFTVYATIDNIGGATLRPIHIEILADSSLLGRTELFGLPARTATQVSLPVRSLNPQRLTVVVDFDGSIREHDEFDNEASADFKPVQATAGTRPDLTVVDISIPMAELTDGQPTVVYVTIDNTGNATLAGGVEVGLCCTDGSMFKTALNGLLPGGSAVIGFPWTASGWTGTDGNITFNATVNFGRTMPEWSFDDNELLRTFLVHLPDLRISSLWRWNTTEGLKAPMFAMVDNLGIGDTVRPTTLDVFIGGQLHSQHGLNGLRAGERLTVPIGWTAISGDQAIRLEVDRQSRVAESVEGNNLFFDAVYTGYPDLSIACITWAPHPDNGSMLTVFAEVQNTGTGSTGRPFQLAHSADAGDAESLTIYGLPANSSTIVSWKWSLRPGEHVFTAVADISDAVMEPNENDDRLMVDYPSGKPRPTPQFLNLLLDNVTYRQSGNRTGDKNQNILILIISVQNTGQQDLPESFAAIIADSLLVAVLPVPRLAVNATAVIAYPWNASTDNHTVKVVVDHQRQFPEDIETDNWISIFIEGNNPPLAYAGGNYSVTAGSPVTLKGFAQDAIDGYIALYEWDLNGDGTYEYNSTVSPVVTHVYYKKGTYTARLRVTDDRGATSTSSALVVVKLKEERPLLRMDELTYAAIILSLAVLAAAAVMIYRKRDEW